MAIVLDGTANTVTPLNGALGATTPSTVVATTVTASTPIGVASGGTGLSSVGTSGNVLTSNGTAWTSATPASPSVPAAFAVGSYIVGRPANVTNYATSSTIAGSSLYSVGSGLSRNTSGWIIPGNGTVFAGSVLVNTGTWTCVSAALYDSTNTTAFCGLWVRTV